MSNFPKVANIQIGDNVYDIKDNLDRAKFNVEKNRTLDADNKLILNKALLADAITEKGVATDASDSLMTMAENISKIKLGDNPAKGVLKNITSKDNNMLSTARYGYPWVGRTRTNSDIYYDDGSGGFKYVGENTNLSDTIFITRFNDINAEHYKHPVLFCKSILPVHFEVDSNYLYYKINGESRSSINLANTITNTTDFYLKVDIRSTDTENIYSCNLYISDTDVDGNPVNFILFNTSQHTVSNISNILEIDLLGAEVQYYVDGVLISRSFKDAGRNYNRIYYSNYLKETCAAVKDENGIYKVVLGASTLYPMD